MMAKSLRQCIEEHKGWHAEHADWIKDVGKWRQQEQHALALLFRLEQAIPHHSAQLRAHVDAIDAHEKRLKAHDERLAELQVKSGDGTACPDELMALHAEEEERHGRIAKAHADFQREYRAAMDEIKRLAKQLLAE